MSKENTGGPAFPYEERNHEGYPVKDYFGMTLRDYFAAMAMQGVCARVNWEPKATAETAYRMADAMLEARGEK
jgi:hypothetical protein